MRVHRRSALVLGAGLLLLAAGIAVGLFAHDSVPADTADTNVRARYERVLRAAENRPPRFDATLVEFSVAELPLFIDGNDGPYAYQLVENEITRRVRTREPSLHPDFATLPHSPFLDELAGLVREGKVEQTDTEIVALLIRQRTAGEVSGLRLRGEEFHLSGYETIVDAADITSPRVNVEERFKGTPHEPVAIEWTPPANRDGALVPLFLKHSLDTVPGKEAPEVESALYAYNLVVTGDFMAPRELTFEGPHTAATAIPIGGALNSPVQLNALGGS